MFDGFALDSQTQGSKDALKRELLGKVSLSIAVILFVFVAGTFIILPGMTWAKGVAIIAAGALAAIGWLSHYASLYKFGAIGVVAITLICGTGASVWNGGVEGYIAPILITSPITAAIFLGKRAILFSTLAVFLSYLGLYALDQIGIVQATPYSEGATSIAALVMLAISALVCASALWYFVNHLSRSWASLSKAHSQLVRVAQRLKRASEQDPLTGLGNRKRMESWAGAIEQSGACRDHTISLILIDLDEFKLVNDKFGHPAGDTVLRHVARRLKQACNERDLVTRIGGDEFMILRRLENETDVRQLQKFCETLIDCVKQPIHSEAGELYVGASIGYACSSVESMNLHNLMKDVDIALYESKNKGRGLALSISPAMKARVAASRKIVTDMETALAENRVFCWLQPQICLASGALLGMEALGRARTKDGTVLGAGPAINAFEELRLTKQFDERVMIRGLDALIHLRKLGVDIPYVSINASAHSLRSGDFIQSIEHALQKRQLSHSDLAVEVLESILIEDRDDIAAQTVAELNRRGVKTYLDDFGSGHASLTSLLQLDVDGLKIDRALIANCANPKARRILRTVLYLSEAMQCPAIVEGIETRQQYAVLTKMGFRAGQGFAICKPVELDKFVDWASAYSAYGVSPMMREGFFTKAA